MSTMYDALRKAEEERKKAEGLPADTPAGTSPASNRGMTDNVKIMLLLVAVIVVFGISIYRINHLMAENKKPLIVPQPVAVIPKPAPVVLPPKPAYVLDGIIVAGKNSMAIINGKMLKTEDALDDLILKTILPKEADFLNTKDNSTVVLRIK